MSKRQEIEKLKDRVDALELQIRMLARSIERQKDRPDTHHMSPYTERW